MAPATPALEISEPLAALLVWVLEDHDVELAKEIIDKPHHFEDLSALHASNPKTSLTDAFAALEAQQRDD